MYAEVDVFISNYTLVDPDIYQLWIEGYTCETDEYLFSDKNVKLISLTATEAVTMLKQKGVAQIMGR